MSRPGRLRTVGTALAAAGLLALGAGEAVAVTPSPWRTPEPFSPPAGGAEDLDVAVNPDGSAVAAWVQPQPGGTFAVQAAVRLFGGSWAAPETLSAPIASQSLDPDAAIDGDGNAVVAWAAPASASVSAVEARLRPFAIGAWQPAQTLSTAGALAVRPEVTIGPSGGVVAAWLEQVPGQGVGQVQTAAREPAAGAFSAPAPLGPSGAFGVTLAADGAGTTLAVVQVGPPPDSTWQTSLRPPGGPFGALQALPGPSPPIVDVDLGPGGRQVAVGPEPGQADPTAMVFSSRTGAGAWSAFAPVAPAGPAVEVSAARVALDGAGNATVVWQRTVRKSNGQGNVPTTVAADGPAAGPFGAPVRLSPADSAAPTVGLGVNAAGTAVALWGRTSGSNRGLGAAVRLGPNASWLPPEEIVAPEAGLSTTLSDPAVTADGVAVAAFGQDGRAVTADRAAGRPGEVTLTASQLLTNQRIDQAAIRRAGALEDALAAGMASANLRPGALLPPNFDASVQTAGAYSGAILPAGPGVRIPVPDAGDREGDPVSLTEEQMLINQRISQAGVHRANALLEWLDNGLAGPDIKDAGIGATSLAPGISIASASAPLPAPPSGRPSGSGGGGGGSGGEVTLSEQQLVINQRISQAAIVRLNSVRAILEGSLSGAEIRDAGIGAAELAP
ncbi:MAG: hypothetical protein AB7G65_20225 [Thermoleophilia bacterium]